MLLVFLLDRDLGNSQYQSALLSGLAVPGIHPDGGGVPAEQIYIGLRRRLSESEQQVLGTEVVKLPPEQTCDIETTSLSSPNQWCPSDIVFGFFVGTCLE